MRRGRNVHNLSNNRFSTVNQKAMAIFCAKKLKETAYGHIFSSELQIGPLYIVLARKVKVATPSGEPGSCSDDSSLKIIGLCLM